MDRLPQELITHVASYIEREDDQSHLGFLFHQKMPSKLPPYATLSRRWQLAIESRTFRSLRLTNHELPYLAQVLVGHRRLFLSDLAYDIVLPTYDDKACAKFETKEDMERNNQVFTDAIHTLFQFLKAWEDAGATMESCHLSLHLSDVYAPMDGRHRGLEKYEQDKEQWYSNKRSDLWGHRYEHSILRLLEHPPLPTLSILSSFQMSLYEDRIIEPKSAVRLANKLSGVRTVALHLSDNEKKYPDIRRQSRYGLATALPTLSSPSLRGFTLSFYQLDPPNNDFYPMSALLPSEPLVDHLSRAIYTLSQSFSLTSLKLQDIIISPELYWPSNSSASPAWPNLRHHDVEFHMATPDGNWYFVRDPSKPIDDDESADGEEGVDDDESAGDADGPDDIQGEPDSDASSSSSWRPDTFNERQEDRQVGNSPGRDFRSFPSDTYMNPLVLAIARAAAQMPKLETLSLTSSIRHPDSDGFDILFHAPTHASRFDSEPGNADEARLYWIVGSWRPHEEVLKAWHEAKDALQIKFLDMKDF
ncbi:MAG: hypothetical protein Q9172_006244 [Xanthocarpia lactea]